MRRVRCRSGDVETVWHECVTAAQVQDFVETYRRTREIYGHDASHAAVVWSLQRAPANLAAYFLVCARAIAKAQYDDGGRGIAAFKTWDREVQDLAGPSDEPECMQWGSAMHHDPERLAIARDELRRLPQWLVDLHLTTGFQVRKACWEHGTASWYFHPTQTGGAVQCRRCMSRRNQIQRQRRRAQQEIDHVTAQ
jgi:hypothetical protein